MSGTSSGQASQTLAGPSQPFPQPHGTQLDSQPLPQLSQLDNLPPTQAVSEADGKPAELGVVVVLLNSDGTQRITFNNSELPPLVKTSVATTLATAVERYPAKTWRTRISSTYRCISTVVHVGNAHWVEDMLLKAACRACYNKRAACLRVEPDGTIAVLPLPATLRMDAQEGEDSFYIAKGFLKRRAHEGPWKQEKDRA